MISVRKYICDKQILSDINWECFILIIKINEFLLFSSLKYLYKYHKFKILHNILHCNSINICHNQVVLYGRKTVLASYEDLCKSHTKKFAADHNEQRTV